MRSASSGAEGLVERRQPVRVEIVHDQHVPLAREVNVGKVPEDPGEVLPGASVGDLDVAPGEQRGMDHEHVRLPVALVLVVVSRRLLGARRQRRPGLPDRLLRRLVETDEHGVVVEVAAVGVARGGGESRPQ